MIRRILLALALLAMPTAALADPISGVILGLFAKIGVTGFIAKVATFFVTTLIVAGASILFNKLFGPKPREQERQASVLQLNIGEVPREVVFGDTVTGGSLIDAFNYGGTYGTDWEVLIIALADHKCHSLVGFYVNDDYVAFASDGAVTGYNNQLEVYFRDGSATQTMPSVVTNGGWATTGNFGGVCLVVVAYKADDPKNADPTWSAGRPQFRWRLKGKLCYDPRKDSSVGGSGTHRWATPSTWEWTDNLSICRYNWLRGVYAKDAIGNPEALLVGRGLSSIEAPEANQFAYANVCDESVALAAGGSVKRYTFNGVIRADEEFASVERRFADCCAGVILQREGGIEVEPGQAKSVTATFTDDDLVVGAEVGWQNWRGEADRQWVNTVVPRYTEPTQRWQDHAAPVRRVTGDVTADGAPREQNLSLGSGVTHGNQAQRVGEIARRMGRLVGHGGVTLPPPFAGISEGDWVQWTSARRFGGATKTLRVEASQLTEKWQNVLSLREIASSVFAWTTADEKSDGSVAVDQTPPPDGWQEAYGELPQGTRNWAIRTALLKTPGALTGSDPGGSATISIAANDWDYPDPYGDVTRASGSLTGLAYSTTYYVYFDDDTLTATSVTYAATTTYADARSATSAHPFRHYLGQITTPASGGGGTGGSGGGGGGGGGPIP